MTDNNFIELVRKNGKFVSNEFAEKVIRVLVTSILQALIKKEDVIFENLGTFSVVTGQMGICVVPFTKVKHRFEEYTRVKFVSDGKLNDLVNGDKI